MTMTDVPTPTNRTIDWRTRRTNPLHWSMRPEVRSMVARLSSGSTVPPRAGADRQATVRHHPAASADR